MENDRQKSYLEFEKYKRAMDEREKKIF